MEDLDKKQESTEVETGTNEQTSTLNNVAEKKPEDTGSNQKANNKSNTPKPEKVTDSIEKIGKSLLAAYSDKKVVYMASDGQGFFNESDAINHAADLTNKKVIPVKK